MGTLTRHLAVSSLSTCGFFPIPSQAPPLTPPRPGVDSLFSARQVIFVLRWSEPEKRSQLRPATLTRTVASTRLGFLRRKRNCQTVNGGSSGLASPFCARVYRRQLSSCPQLVLVSRGNPSLSPCLDGPEAPRCAGGAWNLFNVGWRARWVTLCTPTHAGWFGADVVVGFALIERSTRG